MIDKIDIHTSGPLFDGRLYIHTHGLMSDIEKDVAQAGVVLVRQHLATVLKNPTGYYESRIHQEASGLNHVVTDGGVVYGPWLEGTGSRNNTTRFKGYRTFRNVRDQLDREAASHTDSAVNEFYRKMN